MNWDAIFHQYDIRGIYPSQINEENYYILGRALASYLKVEKIAVGHDTRLSSPSLSTALTSGILDQGVSVVNLGLISTEINYFASGKYGFDANVIISASHNPAEYNGLKIVTRGVTPLHGDFGLPEVKKLAEADSFPETSRKGKIEIVDVLDDWIKHVLTFADRKKLKPLKVVVDAGNGMGGISWERLIGGLPVEIIPMYFEPDGHFPHHLPDPLKDENTLDIKKEIQKQKADLGFAIDGDADRIFVFDETGKKLSGTVTAAMLSSYLLEKYGPAPVLYGTVCGRIFPETVKAHGGTPIRVRVGHSFIKEKMKAENALFAGEHSGHFYFRQNFFADSSTIAGIILLNYISEKNLPLSQIAAQFEKYNQSGEINFKVGKVRGAASNHPTGEIALHLLKEVEKKFENATVIDHVDGLSVWYKDWWFNLRLSNTEPVVRLNVEANGEKILKEKLLLIESEIQRLGGTKK